MEIKQANFSFIERRSRIRSLLYYSCYLTIMFIIYLLVPIERSITETRLIAQVKDVLLIVPKRNYKACSIIKSKII